MAGFPQPPALLQPFADDAAVDFIQFPIPETSANPGRVSWSLGFPPKTMTPITAGGSPPLGQDMNGVLNTAFRHLCALNGGQLYRFNADLVAAIGGYASGAVLAMADGAGVWLNLVNGNTADPDANGAGWVALYKYGYTVLAGLVGGVVNVSRLDARAPVIVLTGVLVGNLQIVLPTTLQEWLIVNATTNGVGGPFTTTVKTAAGIGVDVPAGGFAAPARVYGDGANIYPGAGTITTPASVAATPNTIVLRDNLGNVYGAYLNSNKGLEVPSVGAVFVQDASADGNLRKISITNFEAQLLLQNIGGVLVNGQVPYGVVAQHAPTLFASPDLTGVPTAPTAAAGTSTTQIATTAFANPGQSLLGNGYAILPGGAKISWGTFVAGANGNTVVVYPSAYTAFSRPVVSGAYAHPDAQDNTPGVVASTVNGFTVYNANDNAITCWYIAIGV